MKNVVVYAVCATMMLAGCDTYAGAGAYTGSTPGSIFGSAIGGLSDGPRGSDIGTIIGMAGGAILAAQLEMPPISALSNRKSTTIISAFNSVEPRIKVIKMAIRTAIRMVPE